MKNLASVLVLAAVVFSGASTASYASNAKAHTHEAAQQASDVVVFGSKRGQDPDPYVRYQLNRDFQSFH